MVLITKIGVALIIIGYLVAVAFIFIQINLKQNHACGIPPIDGCIEHDTILYPTPYPVEEPDLPGTIVSSY